MGVCSAKTKAQNGSKQQFSTNPASSEPSQINKDQTQGQMDTKTYMNLTTQRRLRKSGTLSYLEVDKRTTTPDQIKKTQQKQVLQLKIKVNDSNASKDYSVYKGKAKLKNNHDCRVMQHNSDGRLAVLYQMKNDHNGKEFIDWLQKTDLVMSVIMQFYMIAKVDEVFISGKQIQIITEYCSGGTLSELLYYNLSEQVVANILEQMLEILKFLHKNKLSHNQLTIDSFSFYYDLQNYLVKLTDLRSLHKIQHEESLETTMYSSPEFLAQKHPHKSNDIWSVAVIAYQLMKKQLVYQDEDDLTSIVEVKRAIAKWVTKQRLNDDISYYFASLLSRMLKLNRQERYTAEECLTHSFIVKNSNLKCAFQQTFSTNLEGLSKWLLKYFIENYEQQHKDVVYRIFSVLDKDKDGRLNEKEIKEFQRRIKEEPHQQINIEILDKYIVNKQEIDFDEFMLMICNKSIYFQHHNINHCFKKLSNKGEEITIKTLSKALNIDEEVMTKEFINLHLEYEQSVLSIEYELFEKMMNQFLVVSIEQQ